MIPSANEDKAFEFSLAFSGAHTDALRLEFLDINQRRLPSSINNTPALRALCLLLVRVRLVGNNSPLKFAFVAGKRGSAIFALMEAITEQPVWLKELFKRQDQEAPDPRKYFKVKKFEKRVKISATSHLVENCSVQIALDGERIETEESLVQLCLSLEQATIGVVPTNTPTSDKNADYLLTVYPQFALEEIHKARKLAGESRRINLLESLLTKHFRPNQESPVTFGALIRSAQSSLICLSQRTHLQILNLDGDAKVTFQWHLVNAGMDLLERRKHQFWFARPQKDPVPLDCTDKEGNKLYFTDIETTANYKLIEVVFPKPLGPLERFWYQVSYTTRGDPSRPDFFYSLTNRVVTRKLGFIVTACEGYKFCDVLLAVESDDGFPRSEVPSITLSVEGDKQQIEWSCESPRPGDMYRTSWADKKSRDAFRESIKLLENHIGIKKT